MKARHAFAIASVLAAAFAGSTFAADGGAVKTRTFQTAVSADDRGAPARAAVGATVRHAPIVADFGRDGVKSAAGEAVRTPTGLAERAGRDVPATALTPVVRRSADVGTARYGRS